MTKIPTKNPTTSTRTKIFLFCGIIAGPLFTMAWLVLGFGRPNYDPMRHPISSLSIGELGWIQATNFLVMGILTLALAFGLRSTLQSYGGSKSGPILVALMGIGFLGAGFFVTDPMNGYPPGTPGLPLQFTVSGRLHRLFSAFVFLGLPIACFVLARLFARRGERNWANYSRFTGIAFIVLFIGTTVGFSQVEGVVNVAGLLQRIALIVGLTWLTLLPIHLLRSPPTGKPLE